MFRLLLSYFFLLVFSFNLQARQSAAIASAHPLATKAGEEILKAGGNALVRVLAAVVFGCFTMLKAIKILCLMVVKKRRWRHAAICI